MDSTEYGMVMTTVSAKADAEKIIAALLEQRLAACVQTFEINSCYRWKGAIANEQETVLLIKTKRSLYTEIESCIRSNHSYEIPEIVLIPIIGGLPDYLNWIATECRNDG